MSESEILAKAREVKREFEATPTVARGEGIGLLPELFLPAEPVGLRYVGTDCAPWETCAVWSKDHADAHVPAYLEILREKIGAEKPAPAALERVLGRGARQTRAVRSK